MTKDIRFLSGIHRSGNTVLASILKQNPDFYIEGISPLVGLIWENHSFMNADEISLANAHRSRTKDFIGKIPDTFYDYVKEPIIIDRCKTWSTPGNLQMIKEYINPNPKILFTARPLVEVVASLININKDHYLGGFSITWNYKNYMSENDNIAELLLHSGGTLDIFLLSYNSIKDKVNKDTIHVIKYSEILENPKKTIDGVYDFFELDGFKHDFKNIKNEDTYNDSLVGHSEDLHKIRSSISPSGLKPEDILSESMIKRINAMDPYYLLD
jgi:hypothetical protein